MDREEELKQWFSIPAMNLASADFLANNMQPIPDEVVCNLCQQSAEKFLKGYLFFNFQEPPKTHDLPSLVRLCSLTSLDFSELEKKCAYLTRFAVMPKYPNDLQINEDDVKTAIKFAMDIKDFVMNKVDNSKVF